MSPRKAAWLAWCMCAASLVLTVLGLLFLVTSRSRTGAPVYDYWLVNTVIAIGFSTVGAVITPRLPRQNPIGWLFCMIGLVGGVRLFIAEYAIVTLLAEPGSPPSKLPGGEALAWVSSWVWVLHLGLFVFLALLFPDGRPPSSRWRPLVWGIGVVVVAGTVSVALWPETARGFDPINYPLGTEVATDIINPVETIVYALGLIAAASLLARLRRSEGVERQQVKWFTYAVAVLATSATLAYVVSESMGVVWLERASSVLVIVGVIGLPVAVGIAILRYRLYNIDLLINRTLVYGLLTAVLVLVYLASVVLFQELFRTLIGQKSQVGIVVSTLAIAALFNPLRRRIQTFIDRRFYRRKYDARKTLEAFSAKLRDETDLDALSEDLVGVVRETMQPTHVSLWLRQPERAREHTAKATTAMEAPDLELAPNDPILTYLANATGVVEIEKLDLDAPGLRAMKKADTKLVVPLVSQGELIGFLNLGPRLSQQEYSADDRKLLSDLSTQAAPAVRVARLVHQQQEAETRYRTLVEQTPAITYVQEPIESSNPKAVTYVSPQYEAILGYPPELQVIDEEHWLRTLHPEDRERVLAEEARTDESGEPFKVEYRVIAADGRVVWVRDEATLVRDEEGQPLYWLGVQHDVTEQKRAGEALEASEMKYRTLVEQMPAITYIEAVDRGERRTDLLYVSPQIAAMFGYSPDEWMADPQLFEKLLHPDDRERVLAEDARTDETGEPFSVEYRQFTRDGRIMWVSDEAVLVKDEEGRPLFWQGVMHDVTDQKRTEEALRQGEELYRSVIEQAAENIFLVDIETRRILEANTAFYATLGYAPEELEELTLYDIVAHDQKSIDRNIERVVAEGRHIVGERRYRRKDGALVDVEGSVSTVPYAGREVMCIVAHDVTERKRAGEALRFLSEASAELSSSLDYRATLAGMARLAVPHLADWCAVDVLEEDGSTRRLAVEHEDPTKVAWAYELERRYPPDPNAPQGVRQVLRSGRSEFHPEIPDEMLVAAARDPEHLRLMREIGITSAMIVPLVARGRALGTITLVSAESGRRYEEADLELAEELARRAALAVDNAQLYDEAQKEITERKYAEENLRQSLGVLLALREAGQVLGSTLESEEIVSRLLEIMRSVSNLTAAVISVQDGDANFHALGSAGLEGLWPRARFAPEAAAARLAAFEEGERRLFELRRSGLGAEHLVGLCLPLVCKERVLGVLEAYGPESLAESDTVDILGSLASQAATALENAQLYEELEEREERLRDLVGKLLRAQEEEQRRVAYEVHDGLAQVAAAAHQHLQAFAERHAPDAEKGRRDLDRILRLVRATVTDARRIIANLRPTSLDDLGLAATLSLEVESLREEGYQVDYQVGLGDERLPAAAEITLFRVAQEALNNVRKHAQTRQVRIELRRDEDEVLLEVLDYGRGFDPTAASVESGPGARVGLAGMRERINMLGGSLEIRSQPDVGTTVVATIDLTQVPQLPLA